jgi:hypothetical protein
MRAIADTLNAERDKDGVLHINPHAPGCRYCGRADIKYSRDGRTALHHPGTECCAKAIERLLNARKLDKANVYALHERWTREADEMEVKARSLSGKDAGELNLRAVNTRRAISVKMHDGRDNRPQGEWHIRVHGNDELDVLGLNAEIRELEAKLRAAQGRAA